jgi:DNA invertase Pin-like site-specific DNA recombinase
MKAAFYTRVSTQIQSVEAQLLELRAYCASKNIAPVAEFTDTMSGAKAERPGLTAMMAAIRRGEVDTVICVKLDRMARSLRNFAELVEEFDKLGVALICTSQGIDTSHDNACGRLQLAVLAAVASFERSLIQERTCAGLAVARASGKQLGRPSKKLPVGDEARKAVLREWIEATGGRNYRDLAARLGGVSAATALRVARKLTKPAQAAPTETIEID